MNLAFFGCRISKTWMEEGDKGVFASVDPTRGNLRRSPDGRSWIWLDSEMIFSARLDRVFIDGPKAWMLFDSCNIHSSPSETGEPRAFNCSVKSPELSLLPAWWKRSITLWCWSHWNPRQPYHLGTLLCSCPRSCRCSHLCAGWCYLPCKVPSPKCQHLPCESTKSDKTKEEKHNEN